MYQKIVAPLDGSKLAESVLTHVEAITGGCSISELVLVRVVEPIRIPRVGGIPMQMKDEDLKAMDDKRREKAKAYLDEIAGQLNLPGVNIKTDVLYGSVADSLADYAKTEEADLIVIATHGRSGPSRWVWGSVADRILKSACVPVLMVRAPGCEPGI